MQISHQVILDGSEALGLDCVRGSIDAGRLADLVILDGNPLENIRNSHSVRYVIMDGIIYDAATLNEIHSEKREVETFNLEMKKPGNLPETGN